MWVSSKKNQRISELEEIIWELQENKRPIANAEPDLTVMIGSTVYLNGTGRDLDGTIELYEWDFDGDGIFDWNSSISGVASHTYDVAGTYTAVLRVTDNHGAVDEDVLIVKVSKGYGYKVSMYVPVYKRSSRAQDIVLKVTTEDGTPVAGVNVTYRQIEQDFMFGAGLCGWENASLVKELGVNTISGGDYASDMVSVIYDIPPPYILQGL